MTENEAIKEIMYGVCNYKGISKFCHDKCMVEKEKCEFSMAIKALEEIQQYRAIGTVEECLEARERQRGKKRVLDSYCGFNSYECPVCGTEPVGGSNYCHKCGQRLE